MADACQDGVFFHKATQLLDQPDIMKALRDFYDFLAGEFPIEGLVVHHFLPGAQRLLGLYLITGRDIHFLGHAIPFTRGQTMFLRAFSLAGGINHIPDSRDSMTAVEVSARIAPLLAVKTRAHLVCCLKMAQGPLGLVRLLGTAPHCFTPWHLRALAMLALPLGFALVRLLREEPVRHFLAVNRYTEEAPPAGDGERAPAPLIGSGGGLRDVMDTVRKLSGSDAPVLILGETGVGKEVVADAIQACSQRAGKPFIKVNCGAIPETLMDSILFGHEKGAFTGAHCATPGKFEQAHTGTLFLDEVGELSLQAQVRLLRTLQNHIVERVGSTVSIPVDVRILAATNRNLREMLARGAFREDLYYRLNVFTLHVPPLRERMQDFLPLANHFIRKTTQRLRLPPVSGIHPASVARLMRYAWPGNVRELENLVERALILDYGNTLKLDAYLQREPDAPAPPDALDGRGRSLVDARVTERLDRLGLADREDPDGAARPFLPSAPAPAVEVPADGPGAPLSLERAIRAHIRAALVRAHGKIQGRGGAAELLDVHPDTLRKKLKRLGLNPKGGETFRPGI